MAERARTAWWKSTRRIAPLVFAGSLPMLAIGAGAGRAVAAGLTVSEVVSPLSLPEPGGNFTFSLDVRNDLNEPVVIKAIGNDIYGDVTTLGDCTNAFGFQLPVGDTYSCSYVGSFTANAGAAQTSTTTVMAAPLEGGPIAAAVETTVSVTDVPPVVGVDKSVTPASLPAPGGTFTYTITVTNASAEPVTVTGLTDDIYGNLANRGSCTTAIGTVLPPGGSYACTFPGAFTAAAGTSLLDQVTVSVVDDDGTAAGAGDTATVSITQPLTPVATTTTTRPQPTSASTDTSVPTASSVPPPPPVTGPSVPELDLLSGPSTEPGGEVRASGSGCTPGSRVELLIGTSPVGVAQADADGTFAATVTVPESEPGRIELVALCGLRLTAIIDVVVSRQVDPLSSTLAVFIFFVLLSLVLFRRRRVILPRRRARPDADP